MNSSFASIGDHTLYAPALGAGLRMLDLGAEPGPIRPGDGRTIRRRRPHGRGQSRAVPPLASQGAGQVLHCAVTDEDGTIPFNLADNDEGSSILTLPTESYFSCVLRETITVPSRTLASILGEIGWDRVNVLKMDIEGAEVRVLDSLGPEFLGRVGQMTIEFHSDEMFRLDTHAAVEKCLGKLRHSGFLVIDPTYPCRCDVLLINTRHIRIPLLRRAAWRLMYDPPKTLYRLLRSMPTGLRESLLRWRRRPMNARD